MIRSATLADVPAILAFWNPVIAETTITFSPTLHSTESLGALITERQAAGRAFLVGEVAGTIAGFVSYDQFRKGLGYAAAMEHTIILAPAARGQGLGRALITAMEDHARGQGAHLMVGGISGENAAGLAFHRAVGYAEAGRVAQAGRKFERFIDLVLMQKLL
ncbi:GNAT family N-acetyltransferase [Rhodobacter lacus]|uniref:GNAT family N-acetyltransferase n=1 Tax=Rhodobacter lacus TaxID=1641972 RepID=A0ABW5A422_9RHOB